MFSHVLKNISKFHYSHKMFKANFIHKQVNFPFTPHQKKQNTHKISRDINGMALLPIFKIISNPYYFTQFEKQIEYEFD